MPRNTASTPRKNKLKNEQVRKKYDIQYLTGEKHWQDFDELFNSVSHLGTINYNKWKMKEESSTSTWKVDIRERADQLVRESALIQKNQFRKKEAAWRTLENYIFKHLRWSSTWYDLSCFLFLTEYYCWMLCSIVHTVKTAGGEPGKRRRLLTQRHLLSTRI